MLIDLILLMLSFVRLFPVIGVLDMDMTVVSSVLRSVLCGRGLYRSTLDSLLITVC